MLTRSIPIPGAADAASRVRGRSRNSLLCWETVVCSYPYYPCSSGLGNNAVPEDMSFPRHVCCLGTGRCHSPPKTDPQMAPTFPSASTRLEERQRRELAPGLTFLHSPANGQKEKAPTKQKSRWQQKGNRGDVEGAELWLPGQTNTSTDILPPQITAQPRQSPSRSENTKGILFFPSLQI